MYETAIWDSQTTLRLHLPNSFPLPPLSQSLPPSALTSLTHPRPTAAMDYTEIPTPSTASRPLSSSRPLRVLAAVVAVLVTVTLAVSAFSSVSARSQSARRISLSPADYRASEQYRLRVALASAKQLGLVANPRDYNYSYTNLLRSQFRDLLAAHMATHKQVSSSLMRDDEREILVAHIGTHKQVSPSLLRVNDARERLAAHLAHRRLTERQNGPHVMFRARDVSGMAPLSVSYLSADRDTIAAHLTRRRLTEREASEFLNPSLASSGKLDSARAQPLFPCGTVSEARSRFLVHNMMRDLHARTARNATVVHPVSALNIIPTAAGQRQRVTVPVPDLEREQHVRLPASTGV